MKKKKCIIQIILVGTCLMLLLVGCSQKKEYVNGTEILAKLLSDVRYDTTLTKVDMDETLYFPDLSEETEVDLYTGSGYFADEVAMFTLSEKSDREDVLNVIETHVEELKTQFQSYIPEEVGKIEHAVVIEKEQYVFLCITSDYETANKILQEYSVSSISENVSVKEENEAVRGQSENTSAEQTADTQLEYPVLQSKSGVYERYDSNVIRVDDAAYEEYTYVDSSASNYTKMINQVAEQLETNVYIMAIPTSMGVVLPDDMKEQLTDYTNQEEAIEKIYSKLSNEIKAVRCFDNLMKHRDEYIYFRTDFHWTARGAYYAYESFCETKGIDAIPLEERKEVKFDGFLGEFYWKSTAEDKRLGENPDTVYAYYPKSENATMVYTDQAGTEISWEIISDVSNWKASTKYSTFAGADNPIAVFQNPDVTDGSVCVIVKESYGNALLPYLVDHYSTIYEIDYRYWKGNLIDFVNEKQADDLIFANNLSMIRSNYLIGKLGGIID